jgi:membrane associated rhomboid family serine protease
MDRLLARLERRLGRFAVPNLIMYVVAGMAIVWVLAKVRPEVLWRLDLDMAEVHRGQLWRLVTFLFIPTSMSDITFLITLSFTWWVGTSLEQHWGSFKFNVYYLVGAVGTILAAAVVGPSSTSNFLLNMSLFMALATLFPDVEILLFFILPVRAKWLGFIDAALLVFFFVVGDWSERAAVVAAVANYTIFFSGHWSGFFRSQALQAKQRARLDEFQGSKPQAHGNRVCAICGAREADGADIRVCSCEKCGGPRALCLEHARKH